MGNNDMELSAMLNTLTVNIDQMQMGRLVAQRLVDAIAGTPSAELHEKP